MDDAKWTQRTKRIMLAGFSLAVAGVGSAAWLNEPPFSAPLFYLGFVLVGIGVVIGTVLAIRSHREGG